jgi:hypothetical protein
MFLHQEEKPDVVQTYESKLRLASAVGFAGAIAAGIIGGRLVRLGEPGENFWLVFPLLLAVGALAMAALWPWWRRVDDVQKSVHMTSWYWGGMAGGLVVIMALVAAVGPRGDLAKGGGLLLVGQGIGFLVHLGIQRFRQRDLEA